MRKEQKLDLEGYIEATIVLNPHTQELEVEGGRRANIVRPISAFAHLRGSGKEEATLGTNKEAG